MPIESQCRACRNKICTKRIPIFSGLSDIEIDSLTELIDRKVYNKGEVIVREGDVVDRLTIINTGKAKGYRYNKEGKEQILHLYDEGDFFGEKSLLRSKKGHFSIEALEGVHVCTIHKNDFMELVTKHPHIALKIMEALTIKVDRLEKTIESLGIGSARDRVIKTLIEFEEKYGVQTREGMMITMPISRAGIANYIGLTRESVSKVLSQLQDEGLIEMKGNKKILIKEDLKKL